MTEAGGRVIHRGGCHCGAVRFEVEAPARIEAHECDCSMCRLVGYQHLIVPAGRFRLLRGADELREYRFNTGKARHLFCRHCGIKSFYVPRSHPDSYSVNCACVSLPKEVVVEWIDFDGANWERHIERIRDADN